MRRTTPPSRPYRRYAVGLRPSLDPDAYFDAPSQDKKARTTNQNNTEVGLDRPLSFRNDLRKRLQALAVRPPKPAQVGRTRALKRRVGREEIDQIVTKYRSGISTNQLMAEHHIAKRTISTLLRANGVVLRRQGLSHEQTREAADLYTAGRSLAGIADHFGGISPTTVARVLHRQSITLPPRSARREAP